MSINKASPFLWLCALLPAFRMTCVPPFALLQAGKGDVCLLTDFTSCAVNKRPSRVFIFECVNE